MDGLVGRIKTLNVEVIDYSLRFWKLMDNEFFNFDQDISEEENFLLKAINDRILEIYNCFYEVQDKLGWSLQETLDYIEDYYSAKIYAMEDFNLEDLFLEDDLI